MISMRLRTYLWLVPIRSAKTSIAFSPYFSAKSENAVDALLSTQVDGVPLAVEIDTHFYFICAVVGENAGSH